MATGFGLEGRGIESRWGEIFPVRLDRPRGPPSPDSVYCFFPVAITSGDHPSFPAPRLRMGGCYTSASPLCLRAHVMTFSLYHLCKSGVVFV
jgi:hypothetical protein